MLCNQHHDEIEDSGIQQIALIVNWTIGDKDVSSTMLDRRGSKDSTSMNTGDYLATTPALRPPKRPTHKAYMCAPETVTAVRLLRERLTSWIDVASVLHCAPSFATTLSAIARDHSGAITEEGENDLCARIEDYAPELCTWNETDIVVKPIPPEIQALGNATVQAYLETQGHIVTLHASNSYRKLSVQWGIPFSTLRDIARGRFTHVAWETLLLVRFRLDLPDPPEQQSVPICPSCWALGKRAVHAAGDCYGRPVAAVVVLAPGEVVASAPQPKLPKRQRKTAAVIHVPLELHAAVMAERRPGESLADVIRRDWRPTRTAGASMTKIMVCHTPPW